MQQFCFDDTKLFNYYQTRRLNGLSVFGQNSAIAKRQLLTNTTDSNIKLVKT